MLSPFGINLMNLPLYSEMKILKRLLWETQMETMSLRSMWDFCEYRSQLQDALWYRAHFCGFQSPLIFPVTFQP